MVTTDRKMAADFMVKNQKIMRGGLLKVGMVGMNQRKQRDNTS